jgi:hypothetical protein
MPHFKCVACRTRLHAVTSSTDPIGVLCVGCGALLEPVRSLSEVVGFAAITPREGAHTPTDHELVAERVGNLVARREVARAQMRADAERWPADGGIPATAVAVALPDPTRSDPSTTGVPHR